MVRPSVDWLFSLFYRIIWQNSTERELNQAHSEKMASEEIIAHSSTRID